jgi:transcriptional regulator with XRE-family HTH domain
VKADRDAFGPRLRFERERRGIALKDIAASTKIKESLFLELERNDLSHWPEGIFRRSHLCAYASAIGLPPQQVLAEYLRLFPEECPVDRSENPEVNDATGVRQAEETLTPSRVRSRGVTDRAWVVSFDLAAVCLMSSILAGLVGMNLWPTVALVGLVYCAMGSVCFAQSPGTYVQHRIDAILETRSRSHTTVKTPLREVPSIASKRTRSPFSQSNANREAEVEDRRASA